MNSIKYISIVGSFWNEWNWSFCPYYPSKFNCANLSSELSGVHWLQTLYVLLFRNLSIDLEVNGTFRGAVVRVLAPQLRDAWLGSRACIYDSRVYTSLTRGQGWGEDLRSVKSIGWIKHIHKVFGCSSSLRAENCTNIKVRLGLLKNKYIPSVHAILFYFCIVFQCK